MWTEQIWIQTVRTKKLVSDRVGQKNPGSDRVDQRNWDSCDVDQKSLVLDRVDH